MRVRTVVLAVGATLLTVGLGLDVGYHLLPGSVSDRLGFLVGAAGEWAHLVTAMGFAVLLCVLLSTGLLSEARPQ